MKIKHSGMLALGGLVWMCVGLYLLPLGLRLLTETSRFAPSTPFLDLLENPSLTRDSAITLIVALGLFVGLLKGRFVLTKAAQREVNRIKTLPNPASIKDIYSPKYYILIAIMMCLGMSLNFLQVPPDIRGAIDVAIGAALITGAMFYFRTALTVRAN